MATEDVMQMQQGRNKFLMFRRYKDRNEEDAKRLVFQTSHTFSYSRAMDRVTTKDGTLVRPGGLEANVAIEAIQAVGDPVAEFLQESVIKGEMLELWEIDYNEELKDEEGKFPAVYAQGYLDSWEVPADVEGEATISSNFNVEKEPQKGFATVPDDIAEMAQYAFRDTVAGSEEEVLP